MAHGRELVSAKAERQEQMNPTPHITENRERHEFASSTYSRIEHLIECGTRRGFHIQQSDLPSLLRAVAGPMDAANDGG